MLHSRVVMVVVDVLVERILEGHFQSFQRLQDGLQEDARVVVFVARGACVQHLVLRGEEGQVVVTAHAVAFRHVAFRIEGGESEAVDAAGSRFRIGGLAVCVAQGGLLREPRCDVGRNERVDVQAAVGVIATDEDTVVVGETAGESEAQAFRAAADGQVVRLLEAGLKHVLDEVLLVQEVEGAVVVTEDAVALCGYGRRILFVLLQQFPPARHAG